jgi:hypothetical protein
LEENGCSIRSHKDGRLVGAQGRPTEGAARTETFLTEHEALTRALRLLEEGTHNGVSVCDNSGNVLCGVRLQLKLGFNGE